MIPSWLSISCILGLVSHHVLHVLNMKTGLEGVNYYAEVHQSKWNSYIHTLGMPFTIYGMLLWIPALCGLKSTDAHRLQKCSYIVYGIHYILICPKIGFLYGLFYGIPTWLAIRTYHSGQKRSLLFRNGLVIAFGALLFQEVVGHYGGGDQPSRLEGILNAILYAMYYSLSHVMDIF